MAVLRALAIAAVVTALPPAARADAHGFSPGEEIELSVEYLHVKTGLARITVGRPEGEIWPVICQARTEGVASVLDIREHYVSYWDAAARLPRGSELRAVEVGDRHADSARFDRQTGKATVAIQRKGRRSEHTYDIPRDAHDLASALLYLRTLPLDAAAHYELPVFTGSETFQMVADVIGREPIATPAGKFDAVKVKVRTAFRGKFDTHGDTILWFSDDVRHVPVRFSAEFTVGSVVATLTGYKAGGEVAAR